MLIRDFLQNQKKAVTSILLLSLIAAFLEASFILLLRFLAQFLSRMRNGEFNGSDWNLMVMIFTGLAVIVFCRTYFQFRQYRSAVNLIGKWISMQRSEFRNLISDSSFPSYRNHNCNRINSVLNDDLENVRQGLISWFHSLSSIITLLFFIPLLLFFPWQPGMLVLAFLIPVWIISRLRISALNRYGQNQIDASGKIRQSIREITRTLEFNAANSSFKNSSQNLLNKIEIHETHLNRWEFIKAAFPPIMETIYFIMIALLISVIFGGKIFKSLEFWQTFPFIILLLLIYKPIREWSRHTPRIVLGKKAWEDFLKFRTEISAGVPKPEILISNSGKLEISGIDFSYSPEKSVFTNYHLSINPEEITLLSGCNGAGKSTLLKILSRLEFPLRGSIRYPAKWISDGMPGLGYLPQQITPDPEWFMELKAYKDSHIEDWRFLNGALNLDRIILKFEKQKRISSGEPDIETHIPVLSGGELQRLALARLCITNRPYLLLDEPATWLPEQEKPHIIESILEFTRNIQKPGCRRGMLIVSHESIYEKYCDRVVILV